MKFLKNYFLSIYYNTVTTAGEPIFIMGHMRTGSSLLEHILSSNKDIIGAGEQARVYKENYDIIKSNFFCRRKNEQYTTSFNYFTDQILHDRFTPNLDFLTQIKAKYIFIIRDPIETISSLENGPGGFKINAKGYCNTINYYKHRVESLINLSETLNDKSTFFLTYHNLVDDTISTLNNLTTFLNLEEPLSQRYKLKKTTGRLGDSSDNIKIGFITKTKKNIIQLPIAVTEDLSRTYRLAINSFKNNLYYQK